MYKAQIEAINKFIEDRLERPIDDNISRHILDPFDMLFSRKRLDEWEKTEKVRQLNKNLLNKIGNFHELVGQSFKGWEKPGTEDLGTGFDLRNKKEKILFEVKNKWNSCNQDAKENIYKKSAKFLKKNKDWKVYIVSIIVKKRIYKHFVSPKEEKPIENLFHVDGKFYYDKISKEKDFLFKLTHQLVPKALKSKGYEVDPKIIEYIKKWYFSIYKDRVN